MLSRNIFRAANIIKANSFRGITPCRQLRMFSTELGLGDMPDVLKVNYTEEFDQGLSAEEK